LVLTGELVAAHESGELVGTVVSARQERRYRVSEAVCGLKAVLRVNVNGVQEQLFEVDGNILTKRRWGGQLSVELFVEVIRRIFPGEDGPVQKPERVEICATVGLVALSNFRGCPEGFADNEVRLGQSVVRERRLGDPEVDDLHVACLREHNVGGGEISVDQAETTEVMQVGQGIGYLRGDIRG
jgi:hypothetical protein